MEKDTFITAADSFKLLSDPTRLKIFHYLCYAEASVQNTAEAVSMSSPAVSHHLKLLKDAGLLKVRRNGREVLYSISDNCLANVIRGTIDSLLRCSGCNRGNCENKEI